VAGLHVENRGTAVKAGFPSIQFGISRGGIDYGIRPHIADLVENFEMNGAASKALTASVSRLRQDSF